MTIAIVRGFVVRRWSLLGLAILFAVSHMGWIVLSEQHTSEDSTATLVNLSGIFLYAPAFAGVAVGTLLGRARSAPTANGPHTDR